MALRQETQNDVKATKPIRVLFVNHTAKTGGGELALRLLIRHLDKTAIEPQLLLFEDGPIADLLREYALVHIFPLSEEIRNTRKDTLSLLRRDTLQKLVALPSILLRLRRMIASLDIDVVHTNSLKADILGGIAARLAGKRVVWHVRDRISDDYLPSEAALAFRLLARVIPHAIVANSHATLDTLHLQDDRGRTPNRRPVTVIHDGFDFAELSVGKQALKSNLLVGLVGRISPWKGQDVFLRAVHQIHAEFPGVRFQIIGAALFGEEAYADRIRALCAELGLNHCVEFCGFVRDIQRHIATLDVVVHASTIPEPFGQVIIEGMAAGKPVIASRGGGANEIIVDGVSGILVPMNDAEALAAVTRQLLNDAGLRTRLGAAGRRRVEEAFPIQSTAARVSQFYSELCAG